ncbi:hypothetical protein COOONC_21279 [Cooperia oncophora]
MKEAEIVGEQSHRSSYDAKSSEEKPLQPSQISMDEIFCTNATKGDDTTKECNCNACLLTKMSDEERAKFTRQPLERPKVASPREDSEQRFHFCERRTSNNDQSSDWVEELVRDDTARTSQDVRPVKRLHPRQLPTQSAGAGTIDYKTTALTGKPTRSSRSGQVRSSLKSSTMEDSEQWLKSLVGEPDKPVEVPVDKAPPMSETNKSQKASEDKVKRETPDMEATRSKTDQETKKDPQG